MVGLSIIHFSVLSFLFFLKVYIWPLFFFCFWECLSLIYKKNEDNLVHTHVGNISLFFSFWMYMTTFFFFFFKNIWVCRVEEKTRKEKTRCDPADPTGWPGKTRSKPGCKLVDFCFLPKWHRFDLQNSKSCATPCLPYHHLLKNDGKPYSRPQQYRSIVRALQYLTFTRPDIAFSVNQACQFMHNPMESHVVAVKQILRYLRGTLDYGIHFQPGTLNLQAYSDANWAGDPNDRRSVSGFVVYLGSSPISWASKKQHTVSLNIELWLLLLLSSHGFVNCSVICMFHCLFLL